MPTLTVTKDAGGTAKPVGALYVPPELQVLDAGEDTALANTGLDPGFLADLLSACLAHERCGVQLYRSVRGRTGDATLRERYAAFEAETEEHVGILEELVAGAGGDPQYVSPAARATERVGAALVGCTYLLSGSIDIATQELAMLEAVMLAEAKDHANWELLSQLAGQMAAGDVRDEFTKATAQVLVQEETHYGWARDARAQLLLTQATGGRLPSGEAGDVLDLTRDELYAEAQDLEIEGRSKLSKAELAEAVANAKRASE